jgi:hypothetical protein
MRAVVEVDPLGHPLEQAISVALVCAEAHQSSFARGLQISRQKPRKAHSFKSTLAAGEPSREVVGVHGSIPILERHDIVRFAGHTLERSEFRDCGFRQWHEECFLIGGRIPRDQPGVGLEIDIPPSRRAEVSRFNCGDEEKLYQVGED